MRPTLGPFGETWEGLRSTSVYGRTRSWNCASHLSRGFPSGGRPSSCPGSGSADSKGPGRNALGADSKGVKRLRAFGTKSMQIVFLGTSGSWPTPKRNVSAVAVKRGPEIVLFDCGEGTQRQFMQSRLSFMQVSRVFLSHFHGDHFLGLPGMIQSMSMNGRGPPLEVYGPRGVERLVGELLSLGSFTPGFPGKGKDVPPGGAGDGGEYAGTGPGAVDPLP